MTSIAEQQPGSPNGARVQDVNTRLTSAHRVFAAGGILPLKGHVALVPHSDLVFGHFHADGRTLHTSTQDDICSMDEQQPGR